MSTRIQNLRWILQRSLELIPRGSCIIELLTERVWRSIYFLRFSHPSLSFSLSRSLSKIFFWFLHSCRGGESEVSDSSRRLNVFRADEVFLCSFSRLNCETRVLRVVPAASREFQPPWMGFAELLFPSSASFRGWETSLRPRLLSHSSRSFSNN